MTQAQEIRLAKLIKKYPDYRLMKNTPTRTLCGVFKKENTIHKFTITSKGDVYFGCWLFDSKKESKFYEKQVINNDWQKFIENLFWDKHFVSEVSNAY